MTSLGYALARAELIRALTAYTGIATADGAADGTTLIDSNLIGKDSQKIVEKTILIMSGDADWEDKGAASFNTGNGTITLQGTGFSTQIKAGTIFRVLNISSVEIDVEAIKVQTSYTEGSVSGTTTNAYVDAVDVDTRGMKSFSAVMKNIDGANSLDWRLRARPANYAAGADEEIPECPGEETLAAGEKGLAELIKSYSRIKIQVKSTLADTPATYTIDYLINR